MPADFPNYMRHSKLLEYLRMYADHFRLEQYIRFETEVVSMEQQRDAEGRWSVTTRKTKDSSDTATETFDAVMVCVGIHCNRYMPSFEGQDGFKGELMHSVNYRQELSIQSIYPHLYHSQERREEGGGEGGRPPRAALCRGVSI